MENQEFWQFSDQLRLQNNSFANLTINDSIWAPKRFEERRNFDSRGAQVDSSSPAPVISKPKISDFNPFNDDWKAHLGLNSAFSGYNTSSSKYNKEPSSPLPAFKPADKNFNNNNINSPVFAKEKEPFFLKGAYGNKKGGGKYSNNVKHTENGEFKKYGKNTASNNNNNNNNQNQSVDKRFKTLPPSEALPRSEAIGGYIFVCNNDTMHENLRRQLFGLPPRYRDSVRTITPGLPLFLYNYSTHQLHGIFEAASFGGTNIDPTAWEDKKCPGESRFPAQVRVVTRNIYEPLEEDSFRPILHHYDGPKFRLELSIPEALALLDIFAAENNNQ